MPFLFWKWLVAICRSFLDSEGRPRHLRVCQWRRYQLNHHKQNYTLYLILLAYYSVYIQVPQVKETMGRKWKERVRDYSIPSSHLFRNNFQKNTKYVQAEVFVVQHSIPIYLTVYLSIFMCVTVLSSRVKCAKCILVSPVFADAKNNIT